MKDAHLHVELNDLRSSFERVVNENNALKTTVLLKHGELNDLDTTAIGNVVADFGILKSEIKRLRKCGNLLESALNRIDTAMMTEAQREADTKAVGGPVSDYSVSYDEDAVVAKVQRLCTTISALPTRNQVVASVVERWEAEAAAGKYRVTTSDVVEAIDEAFTAAVEQ